MSNAKQPTVTNIIATVIVDGTVTGNTPGPSGHAQPLAPQQPTAVKKKEAYLQQTSMQAVIKQTNTCPSQELCNDAK